MTIRLDPKIIAGLKDISDRIGIAPSTIAGLAIGEYVAKAQVSYSSTFTMQDTMAKEMARVIGSPLAAHLESKTPEELKALFSDDENQLDWTEHTHD